MPVPNTRVANQHIISIRFRGTNIGLIQRWAPRQTRRMTPIYEISDRTSGRRVDVVPGNVETLTVDVNRYDLFERRLHEAFGFPANANHLADHTDPFEVQELWTLPDGLITGTIYQGCWFSSVGREYTATGDRVIMANATMEVTEILNL